jgi:hypothetical protein
VGVEPEFGVDLLHVDLFAVSLLQGIVDGHISFLLKSGIAAMVISVTLYRNRSPIYRALFVRDWQIVID